MAIRISGTTGIDMGNTSVSNVEVGALDYNAVNKQYANTKQSKSELAYNVGTSSYIPNTLSSGAIIERGNNVNGEYVKFADGTLICTAKLPDENDYSWTAGAPFRFTNFPLASNGWPFPHIFSGIPLVQITSINDNGVNGTSVGILTQYYETNTTKAKFDGIASNNITRIIYIRVAAIGRWK